MNSTSRVCSNGARPLRSRVSGYCLLVYGSSFQPACTECVDDIWYWPNQIAGADAFEPCGLPEARRLIDVWDGAAQLHRSAGSHKFMNNQPLWVKSKWSLEELSDKSVEFRFTRGDTRYSGSGEFLVSRNPDGLLWIQIAVITYADGVTCKKKIFVLDQVEVDHIESQTPPSKFRFCLFLPR